MYFLGTCFLYSNQSFQWTCYLLVSFWVFLCQASFVSRSLPSGNSLLPLSPFAKNLKNKLRIFPLARPVFESGLQRYALFSNFQIFIQNFSIFIFLRQSVKELNFLYSHPFFERGCKGRHYFLISKSFFKNFSIYFFLPQFFNELSAFTAALFSNGIAKVRLFSVLPNFSATILKLRTPETALDTV